MAIYKEDIQTIDLETGTIARTFRNKSLGEGDWYGDRFGVIVLRGGQPVDLTGVSVSGFFIRANGTTEALSGSRSGNKCWVDLPAACYAVEGNFTLGIKLTHSVTTVTARIVDGTIVNTTLGSINDPGSIIPDITSFGTLVGQAEDAADTIESFDITETLISGTRYRLGVVEAT
jgi:hypothetical protein